mgnify:CR=1 FL=1
MIRTLETACNNNISHPSLLHKPFLFLDQAFLYGCILSPKSGVISISFGVDSQGYGDNSKDLWR